MEGVDSVILQKCPDENSNVTAPNMTSYISPFASLFGGAKLSIVQEGKGVFNEIEDF